MTPVNDSTPQRLGQVLRVLTLATMLATTACDWIALAEGAATYKQVQRGEAANVVAAGDRYYATLAGDGIAVIDANAGRVLSRVAVPAAGGSIDDLAVDGELLFALDATPPGSVSVYSLSTPDLPRLVSGPHAVPVGPFSGVTAARGLCIVSGGTSSLTAWKYDSTGALSGPVARADLGRGQPDATLAADGVTAFVSTHYWGPYFGLSRLRFDSGRAQLIPSGTIKLDGAGFTEGGAKPANFPIVSAPLEHDEVLVAHARGVTRITSRARDSLSRGALIDVGGPAVSLSVLKGDVAVSVAGEAPAIVLLAIDGDSMRIVRRIPLPPGTFPGGLALSASSVAIAARDQGVLVFKR